MYAAAHRNRRLLGIMGVYVAAAALAQAAEPRAEKLATNVAGTGEMGETLNPVNQAPGGRLVPLPEIKRVSHHYSGEEGGLAQTHGPNADYSRKKTQKSASAPPTNRVNPMGQGAVPG